MKGQDEKVGTRKDPLIIPFQLEAYVTNNKNTPDKTCRQIAPDYTTVEYTSYLGSKIEPPAFTERSPLQAGIHLHFILPGCFRRAEQIWDEQKKEYGWDYVPAPDRWIVARMLLNPDNQFSYQIFIIESDYIGLDNQDSVAIPYLEDADVSHRFLGRSYKYGQKEAGTGGYLDKLTAMGAGEPYFSVYYPNCHSVFGFYDDMSGVKEGSRVSYFVSGYFSNSKNDPLAKATEKTFQGILENLGLTVTEKNAYTDNCALFGEVWGIRWEGCSADYPDGRPRGEIRCGVGNTSAEVISAVLSNAGGGQQEKDKERLFNALQYEVADKLGETGGIAAVEDEIHTQTFANLDSDRAWKFEFHEQEADKLPSGAGKCLADLNQAQRDLNSKAEMYAYWQDIAYADWYSYMLLYEGAEEDPPDRESRKKEILRICSEVLPGLAEEIRDCQKKVDNCQASVKSCLAGTGMEAVAESDSKYYEPKEPVVLLYGDGIQRNYALEDEKDTPCQTEPILKLESPAKTLGKKDIEKMTGEIPELTSWYENLFVQSICLNDALVKWIGERESVPDLTCDKRGIAEFASRKFGQSWLTLLLEWRVCFYPSRSLSQDEDNSMREWAFDGLDYDDKNPKRNEMVSCLGRNIITPHSLYRFEYAAEKYLSREGELDEETKKKLKELEKLPVLSQNLDGLTEQLLARPRTIQTPLIGNEDDEELTETMLKVLPSEKRAVSQSMPFFPLRAGHIHVERLDIVSTFGSVQNAFSAGMNPIYSEVMGEWQDKNENAVYGLMRPRLPGGNRLDFAFVTAEDDRRLAEPAPDTTPVCGFLMPELLNRRMALYSEAGEYYGSIKTVYRSGKPCAAWISPPGQSQVPFEDVKFTNRNMKEMAKYFLDDSGKDGHAFTDFFALVQEHLDAAIPSGMQMGTELSYIWGRPLAVVQSRVSFKHKGGFPCSWKIEDYGKYKTLAVEKIALPVMVGDRERADSGIVGYYVEKDFTTLYPAYHSEGFSSDYIRFGENVKLPLGGSEKTLTLLMEVGGKLYFQTGILPIFCCTLDAIHTRAAGKIKLCFEADSVVCTPHEPIIPVPKTESGEGWYFETVEQKGETVEYQKEKVIYGSDTFREETNIVCDGYLALENMQETDLEL